MPRHGAHKDMLDPLEHVHIQKTLVAIHIDRYADGLQSGHIPCRDQAGVVVQHDLALHHLQAVEALQGDQSRVVLDPQAVPYFSQVLHEATNAAHPNVGMHCLVQSCRDATC